MKLYWLKAGLIERFSMDQRFSGKKQRCFSPDENYVALGTIWNRTCDLLLCAEFRVVPTPLLVQPQTHGYAGQIS